MRSSISSFQESSYLLTSIAGYLVKSQLQSVRIISNFRSLLSLVLASNQNTNGSENSRKILQSVEQLQAEIGADIREFVDYLFGIMKELYFNPLLQPFQDPVSALFQEIQLLKQDSQTQSLYSAKVLQLFQAQLPPNFTSAVTNQMLEAQINESQERLYDNKERIVRLSEENATFRFQVDAFKEQIAKLEGENLAMKRSDISQMRPEDVTGSQFIPEYEAKVDRLVQETNLLKQNNQELRDQLKAAESDQNSLAILDLLRDQLARDQVVIQELQKQKMELVKKCNDFAENGADQQVLGFAIEQLREMAGLDEQVPISSQGLIEAVQKVENHIKKQSQVMADHQLKLVQHSEIISNLESQIQENVKCLEQSQIEQQQSMKQQEQEQSMYLHRTIVDIENVKQKELQAIQTTNEQLTVENSELKRQVQMLQSQIGSQINAQQYNALKHNTTLTLNKIKEQINIIYTKSGLLFPGGAEFNTDALISRVEALAETEKMYELLRTQMKQQEKHSIELENQLGELYRKFESGF